MRRVACILAVAASILGLVALAQAAESATFTVNTANDTHDGACDATHCSLREAIHAANQDDAHDLVAFDIPGGAPHEIVLTEELPWIVTPMTLDALTEPDAPTDPWGPRAVAIDGSLLSEHATGIEVRGPDVVVRGFAIHSFHSGIIVEAERTRLEGNFLGTDASGAVALGGRLGAGLGNSVDVVVGGGAPGQGNLVSGNENGLVTFESPLAAWIIGNRIGTDATGLHALPNRIGVNGGGRIGGLGPGEGNLISGNIEAGIFASRGGVFESNLVGTDFTGTREIPNGKGLDIQGSFHVRNNTISGNHGPGVHHRINEIDSDRLRLSGNRIGTDLTGNTPLPNGEGLLGGASTLYMGGERRPDGTLVLSDPNIISGNRGPGITLEGSLPDMQAAAHLFLYGARIGVAADGSALPNGGAGIVGIDFARLEIGDPSVEGAANVIAFNGGPGIRVSPMFRATVAVSGNSIHHNDGLGLDLGPSGPTEGPMDGLARLPIVTGAFVAEGFTLLDAEVVGVPNGTVLVEFYANGACDPSGHGEGELYLGQRLASVGEDGTGEASLVSGEPLEVGDVVTAIARPAERVSSEFSRCATLEETGTTSDLAVSLAPASATVPAGETTDIVLSLANEGPDPAREVVLEATLPLGLALAGFDGDGLTCEEVAPGLRCDVPVLGVGEAYDVRLTLEATGEAEGELTVSASADTAHEDPVPGNDAASASVTVEPAADLALVLRDAPDPVRAGDAVELSAEVTNHGPSEAHGTVLDLALPENATLLGVDPAQGSCSETATGADCALGTLPNGATVTVAFDIRLEAHGLVTFTGEVHAEEADPVPDNDSAATRTEVDRALTLVVNTVDDGDDGACDATHCSLREALAAAASGDVLGFEIAGEGPHVVKPATRLPPVVSGVLFDATSEPDDGPGAPAIVLDGSRLTSGPALALVGSEVVLLGLEVRFVPGDAIMLEGDGNRLEGLVVHDNDGAGLVVVEGTHNVLLGNRIWANGGLAIDLGDDGVTPNDADDADGGVNGQQNFPVLTMARHGSTIVRGDVNGTPHTVLTIEVYWTTFCDPSGHGEAEHLMGRIEEAVAINRIARFQHTFDEEVPSGTWVTATATGPEGTSELAACLAMDSSIEPIPELGSVLLTGAGLLLLVGVAARRRKTGLE